MSQRTIYGDYAAPAISGGGAAWHIEGDREGTTLCGRPLGGDLSRMTLHVSLLECPRCMTLGGEPRNRPAECSSTGGDHWWVTSGYPGNGDSRCSQCGQPRTRPGEQP